MTDLINDVTGTRTKLNAKITFMSEWPGEPFRPVAGPFDASIDLLEQRYGDDFAVFWHGVVDLACTFSDIDAAAKAAAMDDRPERREFHQPSGYHLRIETADGRRGMARQKCSAWETDHTGPNSRGGGRIAFTGETQLTPNPNANPR